MLRNLENKGNPWGAPPNTREDWTKGLDFEVPRVGEVDDFEYLFWVGCAGAFEDRAKKTTRAVADAAARGRASASPSSARARPAPVTRPGGSATSSSSRCSPSRTSRRSTRRSATASRPSARSSRPARTASTPWPTSTAQLGGEFEVVHHTQLLAHLVATGKLTPVAAGRRRRHLPRPVLPGPAQPGLHPAARGARRASGARRRRHRDAAQRASARSAAAPAAPGCGWRSGSASGSTSSGSRRRCPPARRPIAVGCPFCSTMLERRRHRQEVAGEAEDVEVVDVATVLLRSVKPEAAAEQEPASA